MLVRYPSTDERSNSPPRSRATTGSGRSTPWADGLEQLDEIHTRIAAEIAEAGIADGHVGPRLSRAATSGGGPADCTRSRTDYEIRLIWYR